MCNQYESAAKNKNGEQNNGNVWKDIKSSYRECYDQNIFWEKSKNILASNNDYFT